MEKHGSESYFVVGEGLLTEAGVGRPEVAVAAASTTAAVAPPFRFSRMGPRGVGRQINESTRRKIASVMAAGGGGFGQIPAGYTYLGQFIDHDLTADKTAVTLDTLVPPSQLLQGRSPSLDLDSLCGAGPQDAESAKFYEPDGLHLKVGKTVAFGSIAAKDGFDPPGGAGSTVTAKRKAVIPDHRNDENLAVAQTHLAFIRFHNRVVRQPPRRGAAGAALRAGARAGHQALPVDDPDRLPAPDLRIGRRQPGVQQWPQGVRGGRGADRRSDDADRVLGGGVPARARDDPAQVQLEPRVRQRRGHAGTAIRVLGHRR